MPAQKTRCPGELPDHHGLSDTGGPAGAPSVAGDPVLLLGSEGPPVETETVSLSALRSADSPRTRSEDPDHVRALAELDPTALPPIVVHRATMRVVDGTQRVGAALLRGDEEIEARFVEGREEDMFLLAVRLNIAHGLPLSLTERRSAAERILASHPQWSDRAVAAATGLSAATVSDLRKGAPAALPEPARVGRDGKRRPFSSAEGRRSAGELIRQNPKTPLRRIAKEAGISLGTAFDVRARILRGEDPVPPQQRRRGALAAEAAGKVTVVTSTMRPEPRADGGTAAAGSAVRPPEPRLAQRDVTKVMRTLVSDPSLRLTGHGRTMLRWLSSKMIDSKEWQPFVGEVPSHCTETLAGLARACSESWSEFARQLEQRDEVPHRHAPVARAQADHS
ncbi:hypothetical protein ACFUN7_36855 [Streptomyces sp. NPDC057236]|uniref:hypothetical protein n=1 Tax=Streptomyces sp. NPDC057236 TaxID=3346059 RepID=UPI003637311B